MRGIRMTNISELSDEARLDWTQAAIMTNINFLEALCVGLAQSMPEELAVGVLGMRDQLISAHNKLAEEVAQKHSKPSIILP